MGTAVVDIAFSLGLVRTFTSAAIAGSPVYADGNGTVDLAEADAAATQLVIGLSAGAVALGADGFVITSGIVELTTAEWDAVAGTAGGLAFGVKYFLSATTAGLMSATEASLSTDFVAELGIALSTTELLLRIRSTILIA